MKRIAIAALQSDADRIYEYVFYLLREVKDNVQSLHIVVSGNLCEKDYARLRQVTSFFHMCSESSSMSAFSIALQKLGNAELGKYDELLLVDDSLFGPFYSMQKILSCMGDEDVDFWGTVERGASLDESVAEGILPRHLPAGFLVLRNSLLKDKRMIPLFRDLSEQGISEEQKQAKLCNTLRNWGYQSGSFCTTEDLNSPQIKKNIAQDVWNVYEMVVGRKMPFLPKAAFLQETDKRLSRGLMDAIPRTMDYLKSQGGYDEGLIWQWLLANFNLADLRDRLNLYRIIREDGIHLRTWENKRIAIICHITYEEVFPYYVSYLEAAPAPIDIIVVTVSEERKEKLEKLFANSRHYVQLIVMQNRGRDWAGLLVACKGLNLKYDYFCFLHDKKDSHFNDLTIGPNWARSFVENLIGSSAYIENVLEEFEDNPQLGIMVPPNYCLNANSVFRTSYWGCCRNMDNAEMILKKLGLRVPLDFTKPAVAIGSAFWCRCEAIAPLLEMDWQYDDFPAEPYPPEGALGHTLERVFPYIAQGRGYYTITAMTEYNARQQVTDWRYIAHSALQPISNIEGMSRERLPFFLHGIKKLCTKIKNQSKVNSLKVSKSSSKLTSNDRPRICWLVSPLKKDLALLRQYEGIISPNSSMHGMILAGCPVAAVETLGDCTVKPFIVVMEDFESARVRLAEYGYCENQDFYCMNEV